MRLDAVVVGGGQAGRDLFWWLTRLGLTRGSALLGFVKDDTAYLADRIAERQQATAAADSG